MPYEASARANRRLIFQAMVTRTSIVANGLFAFALVGDDKRDRRAFDLVAPHLPRQPVNIGRGVVGHEYRTDPGAASAPHSSTHPASSGMKHVGLIQRPPLPFVDGAGIAVADRIELPGLAIRTDQKAHPPRRLALHRVQFHRQARLGQSGIDRHHCPDPAIDQTGLLLLPGPSVVAELHAVADREHLGPAGDRDGVILQKRAALPVNLAGKPVEHVRPGRWCRLPGSLGRSPRTHGTTDGSGHHGGTSRRAVVSLGIFPAARAAGSHVGGPSGAASRKPRTLSVTAFERRRAQRGEPEPTQDEPTRNRGPDRER